MTGGSGGADRARTAFEPPVAFLSLLVGSWLLSALRPWPWLPAELSGPGVVIGIAVTAAGVLLMGSAMGSLRRGGASLPVHLPTERLVERGPYRWSRNPVYLGMCVVVEGPGWIWNSAWFLIAAPLLFALLWWGVVLREETYLDGKFPEEYGAYRARVRRWL